MSETLAPIVEELFAFPKFGTGIGFHRMQMLLQPLIDSDWGRRFTTIRVTGSNGKGSVTALVHSILQHLEPGCGRYTSPHLVRFNERIMIGATEITDQEVEAAYRWVRQAVREFEEKSPDDKFGSFELMTALCIRSFFQTGTSVAVMEAGIGGRYDPTRIFAGTIVGLTSVDLEHTDLLGKTRELIAFDKLDLCPDGGTVVAVRQDEPLWERMCAYCRVRRLELVDATAMWQIEASMESSPSGAGMEVTLTNGHLRAVTQVPLLGTFQLENIALACSLVELHAREFRPDISQDMLVQAMVAGLRQVNWPGRLEKICDHPPVFIDVGHSPAACSRLVESVETFLKHGPLLLVTGVSHNKSVEDILNILVPKAEGIICTRAYHMGERVARIAGIVRQLAPTKDVFEAATIEDAAKLARQLAESSGMTVLVAGGLFLSIEFQTAWNGSDPQRLNFY